METDYSSWIGKKVQKSGIRKNVSPKPFKSGLKVNTVKSLTTNPHINKPAFTFEEDDSVVNCETCSLV
jgi:hypothetical protein